MPGRVGHNDGFTRLRDPDAFDEVKESGNFRSVTVGQLLMRSLAAFALGASYIPTGAEKRGARHPPEPPQPPKALLLDANCADQVSGLSSTRAFQLSGQ